MAAVKSSGLGDNFYFHGRNLSGDIGSLGSISGGNTPLEVTSIDQSAMDRLGGLRNGIIEFNSFFDDQSLQAHSILSPLSRNDRHCMYTRGTTLGSPAACMVAKYLNYDPTRAADGSLTLAVTAQSNSYGLEWGNLLTDGVRTDTGATNGTGIDTTAALARGAQAYLQVFSFSGTDVTVKIQDSANNSAFADISPALNFTQITGGAPLAERISVVNTTTIRQYLRAVTVTTGGFSSLAFAVVVVKNETTGTVF